ncbi:hypothetical protein BC833DRAFT_562907 [Globomyces pollinis-pini]|nr:hypothetical protein BC833DRAFT_562907 [Globomyces pollinis-pini]
MTFLRDEQEMENLISNTPNLKKIHASSNSNYINESCIMPSHPLTLTDKEFVSIFKALMEMCDDGLPSLDMPLSKKSRKRKSQKKNKASKIGSKHSVLKLASSLVLENICIGHPIGEMTPSSITELEAVGFLHGERASLVVKDTVGVGKEGTPSGFVDSGYTNGVRLATAFLPRLNTAL